MAAASCWFGGLWADALGEEGDAKLKGIEARCHDLEQHVWGTEDKSHYEELRALGKDAVAAAAPDDPGMSGYLDSLCNILQTLYRLAPDPGGLAELVERRRKAVALTPPGHPDRPGRLANLGDSLRMVFEQAGDQSALQEAARLGRQAVASAPASSTARRTFEKSLEITLAALASVEGDS